jgi:hypothetical protein
MFRDGMGEERIRIEISKDEKNFTENNIDEIFESIAGTDFKTGAYVVVSPFRDIDNFDKKHEPGADVSHFDSARIQKLLKMGLIEKQ